MRVVQESFTVITDAALREIAVLLAGMRITLTPEEARGLAGELSKGLNHLGNPAKPRPESPPAAVPQAEADSRDFGAELRAVKEEMKRNPGFPRTA